MDPRIRDAWQWVRELYLTMDRHRIYDLAAIFSYWSLLALFPFAIFLLTVVGYLPLDGIDAQVFAEVDRIMPEQAARLFEHTVREVIGRQRGWLLAVALLGALWSATGGMASALTALNRAWGVQETRPWWKRKVLVTLMTIGAAGLLVLASCAFLIGPQLVHKVSIVLGATHEVDAVWRWIRWPISVAAAVVALALVYHFLPNVKQPFRLFSPGSVIAVLLWAFASAGFNSYVRHFHAYAKTYGALGAAVVLMVWLYLTGLMLILGGEVNAMLARRVRHTVARGPSTLTSPTMPVADLDALEPSSTNVPKPSAR